MSGDSDDTGLEKREEMNNKRKLRYPIAEKPSKLKQIKSKRELKWAERWGHTKASLRAKVEHPFQVIKRQFGYVKVRYRGLAKKTAQVLTLFALSNLWLKRKQLMPVARRRRGVRDGRRQLTQRRSWTQRPNVVEQRSRIGDWELDTLRASHGKAVVVSMTERRSRLHLLAYSPDGTAENVRDAIVQRLGGLRHTVHTLTADNGKEFADHQFIAACLQSDFYFADPYCAWQRGSNENANGLTRQYLPRHIDFSTITETHLRWIQQRLYNRPRKILGFKTPLDISSEEVLNSVANRS